MIDYSQELEAATQIAKAAGVVMLEFFDADQHQEMKQDGSPVTIADKTVNQLVIDELQKTFPEDGVIGEEASTATYGTGRKWLCDPIDGTKSYIWGVPTAMFSLALVVDGRPKVGVAYDPFLNRLYTAIEGQGSFCNGQPLAVSQQPLHDGWVAFSGTIERVINNLETAAKIKAISAGVAVFDGGVYKCTLVARGRIPAYIGQGCSPYDVAAAELIVTEAGGMMTDTHGRSLDYSQDFTGVLVSNGVEHEKLVAALTKNT